MRINKHKYIQFLVSLFVISVLFAGTVFSQNNKLRTDTRILYHNGPVKYGSPRVYAIFYGNWQSGRRGNDALTAGIVTDLISGLGSSPYFLINSTYPDSSGGAPSGGLVYAGAVADVYSRGPSLTSADLEAIIANQINSGGLPLDTLGIYLIFASDDVTDIRADGVSSFCTPGIFPLHDIAMVEAAPLTYGFVGNPWRCPSSVGAHFAAPNGSPLVTPNGDFAADAMATTVAHLLNAIVTNPITYSGWFDRFGLENSGKCFGKFGTVYTTANGARANIRVAGRDFLIQQNWVNANKGRCSLSIYQ